MENNQQSFWQFSDQLRLHTSNLSNLSLNDSIWGNSNGIKRADERKNFDIRVGGGNTNFDLKFGGGNSYGTKMPEERLNFDIRVGGEINSFNNNLNPKGSDLNGFNDGWKFGTSNIGSIVGGGSQKNINNINGGFNDGWKYGASNIGGGSQKNIGINGGFNKGIYSKPGNHFNNINVKGNKNKGEDDYGGKTGKKNGNKKNSGENNNDNKDGKSGVDKRFKTLPPAEALPRNETIGGYIFVCNNDTMQENLKRELFGLPPRYRDSVRAITPGLPLFLYNYSTHQLHGVFEASSFGGTNIDPTAWEDKKCPGESRFPAQVRVVTRKICDPLEEDSFRPILHHYDGPKFRLELNVPEALSLLDIFEEESST